MIKNFYQLEPKLQANCHGGQGTIKIHNIFEKFETNMQFFHYTVLPPHTSIGVHKHRNNEEFYVVLTGQGEMEVDGTTNPVTAGDVIMNGPYGTHG